MYEIHIEKFQGPLSLLLQLIEQEELDISEVSLAQVTDQYLQYLKQVEELNPEEVADFLVVAAKLLLIKSRLLLPSLNLGGEEEARDLENQLKIYKQYLEAGRGIARMWRQGHVAWVRPKPLVLKTEVQFTPPVGVTGDFLAQAFERVLKAIEPIIKLPEVTLRRAVSIQEKISSLKELITSKVKLSWQTLMAQAEDKTEVVVSFLALLELIKQRHVVVDQPALFHDIAISRATE
jgi:segregation and condensation protein A